MLKPSGIKPVQSKVSAMRNLVAPRNMKQLRSFLGMVNYYRDMWIRRSHILAPLQKLLKKGTRWAWNSEHQRAFDNLKRVMAKQTLLHYPNFNETFKIYTDASLHQIGAVIAQNNKPITF